MSDVDVLEGVLDKGATLIENVRPEQHGDPTPCPEYDVKTLVFHMVGWLRAFAEGANGRTFEGDPNAYASDDPAGDFRAAAAECVRGWREHGTDRTVKLSSMELPAANVLGMTLMEYVTHGLDLARATGQEPPFTDDELAVTYDRAVATLPDQYRGEGMPFAHAVPVPDDAPVRDRLLGFMGRTP
ncbi:MAG TPA: TIGR03086 family metal-binding protein [Mycobacteriales bacterium]|nr:TIGR03086 family metal-binding protein [Mycobacteriales bacterium]